MGSKEVKEQKAYSLARRAESAGRPRPHLDSADAFLAQARNIVTYAVVACAPVAAPASTAGVV